MYEKRTYRQNMGAGRFTSISLSVQESDLWIGWTGSVDQAQLIKAATALVRRLRLELIGHPDSRFLTSLVPLAGHDYPSELANAMQSASLRAGTGPIAAVAGAIAQAVGKELKQKFSLDEIVVENGGDLYVDVLKPLPIRLFAPTSSFSGKLSVVVSPSDCPLGVCTSSARIGHSLSFGRADAVLVAATDAALADAWATAGCNQVQTKSDAQRVCTKLSSQEGILSVLVVIEDTLAIGGRLEVCTHDEQNPIP
ncbi:MAG: UPF0280 family protein [Spirochaetales bacterium]|nr:UPF0280 family protein [Spirochaetales bacterium]